MGKEVLTLFGLFKKRSYRFLLKLLVLPLLLAVLSGCSPDLSDAELIEAFEENRDKFERVRTLAQETKLLRGERLYASSKVSSGEGPVSKIQDLLNELNLHSIYVSDSGTQVDFTRYNYGSTGGFLLYAPVRKGYIYSAEGTSSEGTNRHNSLDNVRPCCQVPQFRVINDHWYLYVPQIPD